MRPWLDLLLVAVFAVLAFGSDGGRADAILPELHAISLEQVSTDHVACDHCEDESPDAMVAACGSVCASPAVALASDQNFLLATAPAPRFPPVDASFRDGSLPPEPCPPRAFLN